MSTPQLTPKCRLHGISVFLSASVPLPECRKEYERIPEAPLRVEEAVVSIARAIFMEGGTLVFGAHPSISPLIARVVDHYYLPAPVEKMVSLEDREGHEVRWMNPSVRIYQSQVWRKRWAEATERLTRHPLVRAEWTKAEQGESINPNVNDRLQAPRSMARMRHEMIEMTSPSAMIAIGGMKGVLDEAEYFAKQRPGKPIYTLVTTGGAAALLAKRREFQNCIRVMDQEGEALVRKFWAHQEGRESQKRFGEETSRTLYVPYAFIAQQIVAEIVENFGRPQK
jgi:hypothetical protein